MSAPALLLSNIHRTYTQGSEQLPVLRGANLILQAGEMVALVGPSGSGKTTLLQIAGLLDTPTSGEVVICGENVSGASDAMRTLARKKYLGFVYQAHHLLPEFSALENIMLPRLMAGVARGEAKAEAAALLEAFGLSARAKHRPARLSGGEQQRVACARALAGNPALLLADEPTGNLDPHTADLLFSHLLKLVRDRGMAALIATHNPELAKRMDRIVQLKDGVLE